MLPLKHKNMKTLRRSFTVLALLLMSMAFMPEQAAAQVRVSVNFDMFYRELSPYGRWFHHPRYGEVWRPDVSGDFRPYANDGHWVWTDDDEWTWYSDYEWGWAPFHYGRWDYDDYEGWFWIPDYEWAPAWVAWRSGDDYYGWAPLRPGFSININIGGYAPPDYYWNFAPRRYITDHRVWDHCNNPRMNRDYLGRTTIIQINNYGGRRNGIWGNSPRREEVERYTHERINPVSFGEHERFGRDNRGEVRGNRGQETGGRGNRVNDQPYNGGRAFDGNNRQPSVDRQPQDQGTGGRWQGAGGREQGAGGRPQADNGNRDRANGQRDFGNRPEPGGRPQADNGNRDRGNGQRNFGSRPDAGGRPQADNGNRNFGNGQRDFGGRPNADNRGQNGGGGRPQGNGRHGRN